MSNIDKIYHILGDYNIIGCGTEWGYKVFKNYRNFVPTCYILWGSAYDIIYFKTDENRYITYDLPWFYEQITKEYIKSFFPQLTFDVYSRTADVAYVIDNIEGCFNLGADIIIRACWSLYDEYKKGEINMSGNRMVDEQDIINNETDKVGEFLEQYKDTIKRELKDFAIETIETYGDEDLTEEDIEEILSNLELV